LASLYAIVQDAALRRVLGNDVQLTFDCRRLGRMQHPHLRGSRRWAHHEIWCGQELPDKNSAAQEFVKRYDFSCCDHYEKWSDTEASFI